MDAYETDNNRQAQRSSPPFSTYFMQNPLIAGVVVATAIAWLFTLIALAVPWYGTSDAKIYLFRCTEVDFGGTKLCIKTEHEATGATGAFSLIAFFVTLFSFPFVWFLGRPNALRETLGDFLPPVLLRQQDGLVALVLHAISTLSTMFAFAIFAGTVDENSDSSNGGGGGGGGTPDDDPYSGGGGGGVPGRLLQQDGGDDAKYQAGFGLIVTVFVLHLICVAILVVVFFTNLVSVTDGGGGGRSDTGPRMQTAADDAVSNPAFDATGDDGTREKQQEHDAQV